MNELKQIVMLWDGFFFSFLKDSLFSSFAHFSVGIDLSQEIPLNY